MKFSYVVFSTIVSFFCLTQIAYAATIDPAAAVVQVRKSCLDNNGTSIDNCFSSTTVLTDWMANTRKPNASKPLQVDIGPGAFGEVVSITCNPSANYTGYIAFKGAGNGQTKFNGLGGGSDDLDNTIYPFTVSSCTEMSFSHLDIKGKSYGGIAWMGGGNSRWDNVNVTAVARGWGEYNCGASKGKHYWFSSKITTTSASYAPLAFNYRASCDESWFFGSELTALSPSSGNSTSGEIIWASGNGIIHVYGSVLRAIIDHVGSTISAVDANSGGAIHLHGTGVDMISSVGNNLVVLNASNGGMIHANETAYNLSTPSGVVTRIQKDQALSHIHAPYLWEHIPDPATIPNYTSVNGADTTTTLIDGQPHIVVYSETCANANPATNKKWYDGVDKVCR